MAKYVRVALDAPKKKSQLGPYAAAVLARFTGHGTFTSPTPTVAAFGAHVTALTQADADVTNKVPGAVQARKAAAEKVVEDLGHLRDYTQGVLEAMVGVDLNAIAALAASVLMRLKKFTPRAKYALGVEPEPSPGALRCIAPSSPARDTNEWQYSTDGKTWNPLGSTRQAILIATGLPIGVELKIRHRQLTKKGYTDWSDPPLLITLK